MQNPFFFQGFGEESKRGEAKTPFSLPLFQSGASFSDTAHPGERIQVRNSSYHSRGLLAAQQSP